MKGTAVMVIGLAIVGLGAWRMIDGQTWSGAIACAVGAFVVFRGAARLSRKTT